MNKKLMFGAAALLLAGTAIYMVKQFPVTDVSAPEAPGKKRGDVVAAEQNNTGAGMSDAVVARPELPDCPALLDPDAYGKKYEDYALMVTGKEGWVFRSKQDLRQEFKFSDEDAALYRAFSDALKSRGTTIVLAVIPTRGMIAHDKLLPQHPAVQGYDAAAAKESYRAMIDKINARGVLAVGTPDPATGADYFNHADQHWTVAGAKDMAQAVAARIKTPDLWQGVPEETYRTIEGEIVTYDGRFGEAVQALCGFRPAPEDDREARTVPVKDGGNEDALFGDQGAPEVVLVGTSNSKRDEFDANFVGALEEALSADVYNAAISGGGMDDSLVAYLDSAEFRDNPPAFLIWEIPGYYNLGGEGMENALRQAIGSVYGYCEKPLAEMAPEKITGEERVYLMRGIGDRKIPANRAYIAIDFDKDVKKDFSVAFKTSDKKNTLMKFKKRREGNGDTFFYLPGGADDTYLVDIGLNVNDNIKGLSVKARLCPLPEGVN